MKSINQNVPAHVVRANESAAALHASLGLLLPDYYSAQHCKDIVANLMGFENYASLRIANGFVLMDDEEMMEEAFAERHSRQAAMLLQMAPALTASYSRFMALALLNTCRPTSAHPVISLLDQHAAPDIDVTNGSETIRDSLAFMEIQEGFVFPDVAMDTPSGSVVWNGPATELAETAVEYLEDGRVEEAMAFVNAALVISPSCVEANIMQASFQNNASRELYLRRAVMSVEGNLALDLSNWKDENPGRNSSDFWSTDLASTVSRSYLSLLDFYEEGAKTGIDDFDRRLCENLASYTRDRMKAYIPGTIFSVMVGSRAERLEMTMAA